MTQDKKNKYIPINKNFYTKNNIPSDFYNYFECEMKKVMQIEVVVIDRRFKKNKKVEITNIDLMLNEFIKLNCDFTFCLDCIHLYRNYRNSNGVPYSVPGLKSSSVQDCYLAWDSFGKFIYKTYIYQNKIFKEIYQIICEIEIFLKNKIYVFSILNNLNIRQMVEETWGKSKIKRLERNLQENRTKRNSFVENTYILNMATLSDLNNIRKKISSSDKNNYILKDWLINDISINLEEINLFFINILKIRNMMAHHDFIMNKDNIYLISETLLKWKKMSKKEDFENDNISIIKKIAKTYIEANKKINRLGIIWDCVINKL